MTNLIDRLKLAMTGPPRIKAAELARACGIKPPSVSDWLSGRTKKIEGANLLNAARCLRVNPDWLASGDGPMRQASLSIDIQTESSGAQSPDITSRDGDMKPLAIVTKLKPNDVTVIAQYDTGGAMGHGLMLAEQPGQIYGWQVNREWIEKNVRQHSGVGNLCIVTGFGDSMRPLYNPGDPLLVDRGVRSMDFDGVYFFRIGEEGFIKRLQKIPTATGPIFRVKSENPKYDTWEITAGMDFEILGRVIKAWCSEET